MKHYGRNANIRFYTSVVWDEYVRYQIYYGIEIKFLFILSKYYFIIHNIIRQ